MKQPLLDDPPSPPSADRPRTPVARTQKSAPGRLEKSPPVRNKPERKRRIIFVATNSAAAESMTFPYDPRCRHCSNMLLKEEARWGTGLCHTCYDACEKRCNTCSSQLALRQLHWASGLCDACYDSQKVPAVHSQPSSSMPPIIAGFSASVRSIILAQVVFYLAPAVMVPSLYLEVQRCTSLEGFAPGGVDASTAYAAILTTTTAVAMAAPIPFGIWAEHRGEREVYVGVTLAATLAALLLAIAPLVRFLGLGLPLFAAAWGGLSAPLSLRGVRAAFFARTVAPSDLSRAGQIASAAGLVGSVGGPLIAAMCRNAFLPLVAAAAHAVAAFGFYHYLPRDPSRATAKKASDASADRPPLPPACERCRRALTESEARFGFALCDECYDTWFKRFRTRLLIAFCGIAALLELSMNAAVVAPFQPVAVEHFAWGSDQIAAVNLLSATLSVGVSLLVAQLNLNEWAQVTVAAGLYVSSTLTFAWPPLQEYRLVVGLVVGLKAQILFMAPFTAAFSRLIGGPRVTNALTTMLCLAPLIGAAAGTAVAPMIIPYAGTWPYMLCGLPAVLAMVLLALGWRFVGSVSSEGANSSSPSSGGRASAALAPAANRSTSWTSLAGPPDLDSPRFVPSAGSAAVSPLVAATAAGEGEASPGAQPSALPAAYCPPSTTAA